MQRGRRDTFRTEDLMFSRDEWLKWYPVIFLGLEDVCIFVGMYLRIGGDSPPGSYCAVGDLSPPVPV